MKNQAKRAFTRQQNTSLRRGVGFHFTFEDWCAWWEKHLGPDWMNKRGRKSHEYVMARKEDIGPYETDNVICITTFENLQQSHTSAPRKGERHHYAKLTNTQVIKIRNSPLGSAELAKLHGVKYLTIWRIKKGLSWAT